jgi:branched-chain amino acid aminotransferase
MSIIPFDQRDGVIWFNGEFVPWKEAKIHVLTHGLHYASSIFEGERAYAGKIFKSREHSIRFHKSAELMDFTIPFSLDQLDEAKAKTVELNGGGDQYVRPVAWRGSEMMAVSAQHNKIHVAIATWAWPSMFDAETKMKGIRLDIADYRRPDPQCAPVHAKAAGLYMICTISKHAAERDGFQDALMLDYRGQIAEATGANIFFVMGDEIHTPKPDCFLDGITRRTVIALARDRQIKVVERAIMPDEMARASECFLTGTAAEITPVGEIGAYKFTPGAVTNQLWDDFQRATKA